MLYWFGFRFLVAATTKRKAAEALAELDEVTPDKSEKRTKVDLPIPEPEPTHSADSAQIVCAADVHREDILTTPESGNWFSFMYKCV